MIRRTFLAWAAMTATAFALPARHVFDDTCHLTGYGAIRGLKGIKLQNGHVCLFFRMEKQEKSDEVIEVLNYLENNIGVDLRIGPCFNSVTGIPVKSVFRNVYVIEQYRSVGTVNNGSYYVVELEHD